MWFLSRFLSEHSRAKEGTILSILCLVGPVMAVSQINGREK